MNMNAGLTLASPAPLIGGGRPIGGALRFSGCHGSSAASSAASTAAVMAAMNAARMAAERRRREEAVDADYGAGVTGYAALQTVSLLEDRLCDEINRQRKAEHETAMAAYNAELEAIRELPFFKRIAARIGLMGDKPRLSTVSSCWVPLAEVEDRFNRKQRQPLMDALQALVDESVLSISKDRQHLSVDYPLSDFAPPRL